MEKLWKKGKNKRKNCEEMEVEKYIKKKGNERRL